MYEVHLPNIELLLTVQDRRITLSIRSALPISLERSSMFLPGSADCSPVNTHRLRMPTAQLGALKASPQASMQKH